MNNTPIDTTVSRRTLVKGSLAGGITLPVLTAGVSAANFSTLPAMVQDNDELTISITGNAIKYTNLNTDDPLRITYTITGDTSNATNSTSIDLTLPTSTGTITPPDQPLTVPNLTAGEDYTITIELSHPSMIAPVTESINTNTQGITGANISPQGTITSITSTQNPIPLGENIQITVTVQNNGGHGNIPLTLTINGTPKTTTLTNVEPDTTYSHTFDIDTYQYITTTTSDLPITAETNNNSKTTTIPTTGTIGEHVFTQPGTTTWPVPNEVTTISAVAVGGGGGGGGNEGSSGPGSSGGGGGGLAWKKEIDVSSVNSLTITVGAGGTAGTPSTNGSDGGTTFIEKSGNRVLEATGGKGGISNTVDGSGGTGGTNTISDGGGSGGKGGDANNNGAGAGGGGAGGYTGSGGAGSAVGYGTDDGAGGGGAGGIAINSSPPGQEGQGGGVELYGRGPNGTYSSSQSDRQGSRTAKIADSEYAGDVAGFDSAGDYGGGGAGVEDDTNANGGTGGTGAVRIIWGPRREYPDKNTREEYSLGNVNGN